MLTDALSKEVAQHNINVNCVAPGTVWGTPMVDWVTRYAAPEGTDPREAYLARCRRMYTFGREQTPEDIANAMLFLASEESRNITGYTIYVDGGHKGSM
jgi:NAD(P)-dependent dehydrogenase (short-subunit alcohol dehydrogenase family)